MEEGGFQFQPGISARLSLTALQESPDIDWDGLHQLLLSCDNAWPGEAIDDASSSPDIDLDGVDLDHQLLPPGDIPWPEMAIDASSSPNLFASPSTVPSDATATTAATNTLLSQPNTCSSQPGAGVASQGAMVDLDLDRRQPLAWLQVATVASRSSSHFDPPSTFPLDPTANRGTHGITNACLSQSGISVLHTTSSEGAAVHFDGLLKQTFPGVVPIYASTSPSLFATPSDAENTCVFGKKDAENTSTRWTGANSSVQGRVKQALTYIWETETQRGNNMIAQLWVPAKDSPGHLWLRTSGQPLKINPNSDALVLLMNVPTRLMLSTVSACKLPEWPDWSPNLDIRYFTKYLPIVNQARYLALPGVLGLPVFDKGNNSCLGVIELLTIHKLNFSSDLDNICTALQAVNLTTTRFSTIPGTKFNAASYTDASSEILQVLRAACNIHGLPLAQTWVTCAQQGKQCRHHSDENCRYCISTIDAACYVNDPRMQNFHEACCEHHLLPGQGVAGKAFATNQPCFLPDIGSSREHEYPLSNHARIFKLKGAVAIRLRCTRTGTADFVLEFYLPTDCGALREQKAMLDSLWGTVRSLSKTLCMVTDKEMEEDAMWGTNKINLLGLQINEKAMKRKRMARRSTVWNSFTEVMVGDTAKAKCNHCGLELCCDSKNGTSSLRSRLKRCKLNPDNRTTCPNKEDSTY